MDFRNFAKKIIGALLNSKKRVARNILVHFCNLFPSVRIFEIGDYSLILLFLSKDTNRKIRMTMIIYIYRSLIGSKLGSSRINTGEGVWETHQRHCAHLAWYLEPKLNHSIIKIENVFFSYLYFYPPFLHGPLADKHWFAFFCIFSPREIHILRANTRWTFRLV